MNIDNKQLFYKLHSLFMKNSLIFLSNRPCESFQKLLLVYRLVHSFSHQVIFYAFHLLQLDNLMMERICSIIPFCKLLLFSCS